MLYFNGRDQGLCNQMFLLLCLQLDLPMAKEFTKELYHCVSYFWVRHASGIYRTELSLSKRIKYFLSHYIRGIWKRSCWICFRNVFQPHVLVNATPAFSNTSSGLKSVSKKPFCFRDGQEGLTKDIMLSSLISPV